MLASVREGEVLNEKFRVDRVLGEGGMGVVVAATHLQLGEPVALKFLREEAMSDSDVVRRFAREARTAAKMRSEHIARVYDVGELPSGLPFIVMELLTGMDLAAHIRDSGALPIEEAVEYVLQTCEALAEAHAMGIIHRDLKPSNLFLTRRGDGSTVLKVLDFGVSKVMPHASGVNDLSLTQTAMVIGTPMYMSPEQMRGRKEIDARADIWSLGVILYEALTGELPFFGETLTDLCALIVTETPPSISDVRPDVPRTLELIVLRCLDKHPDARFADVGTLASALAAFGPADAAARAARIARMLEGVRTVSDVGRSRPPSGPPPRGDASTVRSGPPTSSQPNDARNVARAEQLGSIAGSSRPASAAPRRRSIQTPVIGFVVIGAVALIVVAWISGLLRESGSSRVVSAPSAESHSTGLVATVPAPAARPAVDMAPTPATALSSDVSPQPSAAKRVAGRPKAPTKESPSPAPSSTPPTSPVNPLDLKFK
jgi:serine/threonine-protein kinase